MEIVSSYGAVLEGNSGSGLPTIKQSELELPYPKQSIGQAIALLQQAKKQPHMRAFLVQSLSPEEAQLVLSSQFERGLDSGLAFLDTFVPPAEAEAEKKQWEDILKLADKIDPELRRRFENPSQRAKDASTKK